MNKRKLDFEPVHIRAKKIAGGRRSLFLDIAKDGVRKREFLKLYLMPEDSKGAKSANKSVMRMAEEMKAKRTLEVMRDGLQLPDHDKGNVVLVDYYRNHGNTVYARTIQNIATSWELPSVQEGHED